MFVFCDTCGEIEGGIVDFAYGLSTNSYYVRKLFFFEENWSQEERLYEIIAVS